MLLPDCVAAGGEQSARVAGSQYGVLRAFAAGAPCDAGADARTLPESLTTDVEACTMRGHTKIGPPKMSGVGRWAVGGGWWAVGGG